MFFRAQLRQILQRVPGKERLGIYRFLPFFFVLGAAMEWIMIRVRVGQETFYDVYRRKASERQYQRRLEETPEGIRLHAPLNAAAADADLPKKNTCCFDEKMNLPSVEQPRSE
ncbi:PREDICTED: small integral membrane protein 4 [Elephantulus edwardii]|uniref:small integral membrane protein 4 n=1 Tax=Elephantulus edwardii TaxID=28737 RepID=UPI0003F0989D|nr:PREDICTED: small integral membrane protein 4 [Elephantulus edwardii]